jgi:hypothetical protein
MSRANCYLTSAVPVPVDDLHLSKPSFRYRDAMQSPGRAKISFCTTCKNRLWQLAHTMPRNLFAIRADGCAEMVLVNYNSEDGLDTWIRQFRWAVEAGTLRYVHEQSDPYFHTAKAKNLAHLAATGEFVVNLDADNFIGDTIARYRRFWADNPETVIQGFSSDFKDGTYGRIGMAKHHFIALGGYDEEMLAGAVEDMDLIGRAEAFGLDFIKLAQRGPAAIRNHKEERIRYSATRVPHQMMVTLNSARMKESIRLGRLIANRARKPRPVLINFSTELEL